MFKKTLVAAAVTATAFGASAVETTFTSKTVSVEGFGLAAATAKKVNIGAGPKITTGANYSVGDTVTFTLGGGLAFDTTKTYSLTKSGNTACTGAGAGTTDCIEWGLLNASASELTFRVTALRGTVATGVDYFLQTGAVKATPDTFEATITSAAKSTITSVAKTQTGIVIDSAVTPKKDEATILTASTQVKNTVTKATPKVDVSKDKKGFSGSATIKLAYDYTASADFLNYTPAAATVKLTGDFTGIKEITCTNQATTPVSCSTAKFTIAEDKQSATVRVTDFAAADFDSQFAFVLPAAADAVELKAPQDILVDFTSDTAVDTNKVAQAQVTGASWTLNGSVVEVPYMPFGDNTAPVMRITNTSTKTGDLSVRYMLEGKDTEWKTISGALASIKPGVTDIGAIVMDAIKADAGVDAGKVAIEVTTNVPGANVELTTLFKVKSEADRAVVKNVRKDS